jgi:hypothetical protein
MVFWMMELAGGWYAYLDDEHPLGPFATQDEALAAAANMSWPVEA